MNQLTLSLARRLAAGLLGLTMASGLAMAQGVDNPLEGIEPTRTVSLDDGTEAYVYEATVIQAVGNRVTVRFADGGRHTYNVPSNFRFNIDGRMVPTRQLQRDDQLRVYAKFHPEADHEIVEVDESGAAPVVMASAVAEPTADPEPTAAMLPSTASPLPFIGLFGLFCTALGGLGLAIRRRFA